MFLTNESGSVGYLALQGNKGRIIVIDNELTPGMIINKKYVIAHKPNVVLRKPPLFPNEIGTGRQIS